MEKKKIGLLSDLIISRSNFVELVIVAVLLGLSINIIANYIPAAISYPPDTWLYIGIGVTITLLLYLSVRFFGQRNSSRSFFGFFTYSIKENQVLETYRYKFSEDLTLYLKAAFAENAAIKVLWEEEPLIQSSERPPKKDTARKTQSEAARLIIEATEYFVLAWLSTHLVDYFRDDLFKSGRLKEFSREDIPTILLQNRFLELFSMPMRDRPQFVKGSGKGHPGGTIVMAITEGGALYESFSLVLPHGTIMSRLSNQSIKINTRRIVLEIDVIFTGLNTYIPHEFHRYIQGINDLEGIRDYKVGVEFKIHFKFGALFMPSGWHYYHWLDSFLRRFDEIFSQSTFFENIGWENALTVIDYLNDKKPKRGISNS